MNCGQHVSTFKPRLFVFVSFFSTKTQVSLQIEWMWGCIRPSLANHSLVHQVVHSTLTRKPATLNPASQPACLTFSASLWYLIHRLKHSLLKLIHQGSLNLCGVLFSNLCSFINSSDWCCSSWKGVVESRFKWLEWLATINNITGIRSKLIRLI